uniref:Uncharacterized protein n=1 Tax=Rhizophora mucronata TaxID=61149 RepID=A0A2P2R2K6_RHIMU
MPEFICTALLPIKRKRYCKCLTICSSSMATHRTGELLGIFQGKFVHICTAHIYRLK